VWGIGKVGEAARESNLGVTKLELKFCDRKKKISFWWFRYKWEEKVKELLTRNVTYCGNWLTFYKEVIKRDHNDPTVPNL